MSDSELISRYNYDIFEPAKFGPWMRFDSSPSLGERAPDLPLWELDVAETSLFTLLRQNTYTVIEFGSFT